MTDIKQSLGELVFLFYRGKKAYQEYKKNEQSFLYAKILKDNNDRIRDILFKISHLLPADLNIHSINLMFHLDVWTELWVDLFNKEKPRLNSRFVFQNTINYPYDAELVLIEYYKKLREQ